MIDEKECLLTPKETTGEAVWMNFDCTGMVGSKIRFSKPNSHNSLTFCTVKVTAEYTEEVHITYLSEIAGNLTMKLNTATEALAKLENAFLPEDCWF